MSAFRIRLVGFEVRLWVHGSSSSCGIGLNIPTGDRIIICLWRLKIFARGIRTRKVGTLTCSRFPLNLLLKLTLKLASVRGTQTLRISLRFSWTEISNPAQESQLFDAYFVRFAGLNLFATFERQRQRFSCEE